MNGAVWVTFGPGIPCGAREVGDAGGGRVWLDMCALGQHVPQMYRPGDMHELTADRCARLGLCETCLGYGDLGRPPTGWEQLARRIDEVGNPCPSCGGSGRPAVRSTAARDEATGEVTGGLRFLPHAYVPPPSDLDPDMVLLFEVPADMCLACGNGRGFEWRGEPLHTRETP